MEHKRQFIIQVTFNKNQQSITYINKIYKNILGYYFGRTVNIKKAKVWKFRKNCQNNIDKLKTKLDPTKTYLKEFSFEIIEITDNTILRSIKLKKLNKNGNKNR